VKNNPFPSLSLLTLLLGPLSPDPSGIAFVPMLNATLASCTSASVVSFGTLASSLGEEEESEEEEESKER
jgi:hypothetical protein